MDDPKHIRHPEGFDYKNFFIDILSDPTAYINMLRSQNVTAHRFSLEWSVIEPNPGQIDMDAVACYRNFIQALIAAGITPSVTLNHFVVPEWFYKKGNFQKMENIDFYVQFALRAMELFPNVKSWWSFNELGIKAFQQTREVFPTDLPEGSSLAKRVHAAGRSTMNMLIAHCKLTQEVLQRHPDKRIGVTHQWLKFDTATENCLERLVAHVFTKFAFTPVYQFFKEGRFSFEIPLMANIQFEVPKEQFEANGKFLMQLGVQAYPQAMIKMGLNHGKTYPGLSLGNKNPLCFIFGSTCEPGGTLMRFGPRWRAEGMDEALDEAFKLTDQVYITEYGSDAMTQSFDAPNFQRNDEAQAHYLQQLTERIRNYSRRIKGLYCWSDVRQMEWNEGQECKLSMITPVVNSDQRMVDWEQTHAARYLQEAYREEPLFQATAVSNGA
jgi:beta-glucosidase/6-phospho-beta-glucosidase/beta-galactosidase